MPKSKDSKGLLLKAILKERFSQLLAAAEEDIRSGRIRSARTFLKAFKRTKKISG
jgi:hypothetical protein